MAAQEPVRAGVVGTDRVGRPAPALVGRYFNANGPGPIDQPFRLSAELGRVVVVLLGPVSDTAGWRSAVAAAESLPAAAVVVGVVREAEDGVAGLATRLNSPRLKFLADPTGQSHRAFAAKTSSWTAVVVDDTGRIGHHATGVGELPGLLASLAAAVGRGRSIPN